MPDTGDVDSTQRGLYQINTQMYYPNKDFTADAFSDLLKRTEDIYKIQAGTRNKIHKIISEGLHFQSQEQ
jgi:hypothetical protein